MTVTQDVLDVCLEAENLCADVYGIMSRRYPEHEDFFDELRKLEENHAEILIIAKGLSRMDVIIDNFLPSSCDSVKDTVDLIKELRSKLLNGRPGLPEVIHDALQIEDSVAEVWLQEVMLRKAESDGVGYLQKFLKDEEYHADKIRRFISELGYDSLLKPLESKKKADPQGAGLCPDGGR